MYFSDYPGRNLNPFRVGFKKFEWGKYDFFCCCRFPAFLHIRSPHPHKLIYNCLRSANGGPSQRHEHGSSVVMRALLTLVVVTIIIIMTDECYITNIVKSKGDGKVKGLFFHFNFFLAN